MGRRDGKYILERPEKRYIWLVLMGGAKELEIGF